MVKIIMHGCNGAMGQVIKSWQRKTRMQRSRQVLTVWITERIHIRYLHLVMHVMWKRM